MSQIGKFLFDMFWNMDISLIITHMTLKTCMHNVEICLEGSVSQNFDIDL